MKATQALLILSFLLISILDASAEWQFYEKTSIKGTVSGTVKKGRTFEMASGSIYEVTDLTLQLVLELAPETTIFRDGSAFKLIVKGFDEPLICKQLVPPANMVAPPQAVSPARASLANDLQNIPLEKIIPENQQKEFGIQKLSPQEKDKLRFHILALCSKAYELGVQQAANSPASQSSKASPSVIESQLEGDSEGFSGETIFQLTNGQIWKQTEYYYEYDYAYRPKVLIYNDGSGYKIKIDGIDEAVGVKRLK